MYMYIHMCENVQYTFLGVYNAFKIYVIISLLFPNVNLRIRTLWYRNSHENLLKIANDSKEHLCKTKSCNVWCHLGKPGLWRSKQYFPLSAFSIKYYILFHNLFLNCVESEKLFCTISMCDKKVQAQIRQRAKRTTSDQSLLLLLLHKPGFPRWNHVYGHSKKKQGSGKRFSTWLLRCTIKEFCEWPVVMQACTAVTYIWLYHCV